LTFAQMHYFVVLAKCMNFTEAAKRLYITQPTLSRQIQSIENELGLQLLVRSGRGVSLTETGKLVAAGFERLYNEYVALLKEAAATDRAHKRKLCVGIIDFQSINPILSRAINQLSQGDKAINIQVQPCGYKELQDGLLDKELDIAVTYEFDVLNRSYLKYKKLYDIDTYLAVPADHPNVNKPDPSLADFKDIPLISLEDDETPNLTPLLVSSCREAGFSPKIKLVGNYRELAVALNAGQGMIGLNPEHYLYYNPSVKFIKVPEMQPTAMVAAWNPENGNPAIRLFLDALSS
jgi:DNA-binding transcriptional LysR family regulator